VRGMLTCEDIIHSLEEFFKHGVTPHLLWDFTSADLSGITQKDMEEIITVAKSYAHLRKNGKTALLVPKDLSFGLSRMYETLSEIREHPILHRLFRDMGKAMAWLESGE